MPGMIQHQMLTTALLCVCLEGKTVVTNGCDDCYFAFVSNKKVVGIATKSRKEHPVAQTRELACMQVVMPQVLGRGEFNS